MRKCIIENCDKKHYGRGWCRKHYRILTGEYKKTYIKIKNSPSYKKYQKEWWTKNRGRYHKDPEYIKGYYLKNKKQIIKRIMAWKKKQPIEKKRQWYIRDNLKRQFSGWEIVEDVLRKYNYSCAYCGITQEEHRRKYNQSLNIHHINGLGRSKPKELKDNRPENLIPLCKSCHKKEEYKLAQAG